MKTELKLQRVSAIGVTVTMQKYAKYRMQLTAHVQNINKNIVRGYVCEGAKILQKRYMQIASHGCG